MKITVSARGKTLDSDMDPRFGRSAGFVLFDTETGQTVYLDNSAQLGLAQGTGIKAAQVIADAGTDVLITGQHARHTRGPKDLAVQLTVDIGLQVRQIIQRCTHAAQRWRDELDQGLGVIRRDVRMGVASAAAVLCWANL